jgi:hypothetical protein
MAPERTPSGPAAPMMEASKPSPVTPHRRAAGPSSGLSPSRERGAEDGKAALDEGASPSRPNLYTNSPASASESVRRSRAAAVSEPGKPVVLPTRARKADDAPASTGLSSVRSVSSGFSPASASDKK